MDSSAAASIFSLTFTLAFVVLMIASAWKLFEKANHPGWACILPIYNAGVMLNIAGMSALWLFVMVIPYVGCIPFWIMSFRIASAFRKDALFGLGLALLPFVFYPLLALRDEIGITGWCAETPTR